MIKITKVEPPDILVKNGDVWKKALIKATTHYGGYESIPNNIKSNLTHHYKKQDIKNALSRSSHGKCAFCESKLDVSGNLEVEHFAPKSLYPEFTFDWDNLLPACRNCNQAKSDHDTIEIPIIDPSKNDPEEIFDYDLVCICPTGTTDQQKLARETIEVCNLNRPALYSVRAQLLSQATKYIDDLRHGLEALKECSPGRKFKSRLTHLQDSIDTIDLLLADNSPYAGYCRWLMLSKFPEYTEAKDILQQASKEE